MADIPQDKLDLIRAEARKARGLEFDLAELEERAKEIRGKLNTVYLDTLPKMMKEVGLDSIGIPKDGNYPGYDYKLKKKYRANIAASWDDERREEAFAYVTRMGAADLIKTEVVTFFPKGGEKLAKQLIAVAKKMKVNVIVGKKKIARPVIVESSKSIPHASLTSWLKELVEKRRILPPLEDLDKIGATIVTTVEPVEREENI